MFICAECNKQFDPEKYDVGRKYCSVACVYWSGVDYSGTGCWTWKKRKGKKGYGILKWKGRQHFAAHRIGFALTHSAVPGEVIGDLFNICGNKSCVRGDHWTTDSAYKWHNSDRYREGGK